MRYKFEYKLMNWHKIYIIAIICISISAMLPPYNIIHIISAVIGFICIIVGCVASVRQGISGKKSRASEKDSTKAYYITICLSILISLIYGHFFEFSIFNNDIFKWLK